MPPLLLLGVETCSVSLTSPLSGDRRSSLSTRSLCLRIHVLTSFHFFPLTTKLPEELKLSPLSHFSAYSQPTSLELPTPAVHWSVLNQLLCGYIQWLLGCFILLDILASPSPGLSPLPASLDGCIFSKLKQVVLSVCLPHAW